MTSGPPIAISSTIFPTSRSWPTTSISRPSSFAIPASWPDFRQKIEKLSSGKNYNKNNYGVYKFSLYIYLLRRSLLLLRLLSRSRSRSLCFEVIFTGFIQVFIEFFRFFEEAINLWGIFFLRGGRKLVFLIKSLRFCLRFFEKNFKGGYIGWNYQSGIMNRIL